MCALCVHPQYVCRWEKFICPCMRMWACFNPPTLRILICVYSGGGRERGPVCASGGGRRGEVLAAHCHVASFSLIVLCSLESVQIQYSRFIDAQPLIRNACIHLLESFLSGSLLPGCHKHTQTHTCTLTHTQFGPAIVTLAHINSNTFSLFLSIGVH